VHVPSIGLHDDDDDDDAAPSTKAPTKRKRTDSAPQSTKATPTTSLPTGNGNKGKKVKKARVEPTSTPNTSVTTTIAAPKKRQFLSTASLKTLAATAR
jgi:cell division septation protein DedD